MRIGLIVEGFGEVPAIQILSEKLKQKSSHQLVCRPLHADLQPKATPLVIAQSARVAVNRHIKDNVKKNNSDDR